jgi:hypothetical protein
MLAMWRNGSHTSLHQWFLPPSIFTASCVCVCVCLSLSLVFRCLNNNHLKASHPSQSTQKSYLDY